jgi:nucleoside-diphosphate-sugar epimerase
MAPKVLVTGSSGQIGSELVPYLRSVYGRDSVVAADIRFPEGAGNGAGPAEILDVSDGAALASVVRRHGVDTIYHLAGLLSATGENNPQQAWRVNIDGLRNVLDAARAAGVSSVFWPSSIAVFGPDTPKRDAPQKTPLNPTTMYGVTKVTGELLCNYYFLKYGLDVRSLRYPGLVSSKALPGGGTTDYAVEIFYAALTKGSYTCFLREDTVLPMMYMPDALRASVSIMQADRSRVPRHMGYNLAAISFSAGEIAGEIRKHVPGFRVGYAPDRRQDIADSWPESVSDAEARRDWGWSHEYDLASMTSDMLKRLGARLKPSTKDV